jgi:hypothetical protein
MPLPAKDLQSPNRAPRFSLHPQAVSGPRRPRELRRPHHLSAAVAGFRESHSRLMVTNRQRRFNHGIRIEVLPVRDFHELFSNRHSVAQTNLPYRARNESRARFQAAIRDVRMPARNIVEVFDESPQWSYRGLDHTRAHNLDLIVISHNYSALFLQQSQFY